MLLNHCQRECVTGRIAGTCDCLEPECTVVKERGECQWNVCNLKLTEYVAESLCGKVCVESEQSQNPESLETCLWLCGKVCVESEQVWDSVASCAESEQSLINSLTHSLTHSCKPVQSLSRVWAIHSLTHSLIHSCKPVVQRKLFLWNLNSIQKWCRLHFAKIFGSVTHVLNNDLSSNAN